jgi:hypothetical protein
MPYVVQPVSQAKAHLSTLSALFRIADLKKEFRTLARTVKTAKEIPQQATSKAKPSYKTIEAKRALSKAGKTLKAAKDAFKAQLQTQAQLQCRPICENMFAALPRELRSMAYAHLIAENSATFYVSKDDAIKVANSSGTMQHYLDADFTGPNMHADVIDELNHLGVRFDFRRRHALLAQVFSEYKSTYGYDFASKVNNVGLSLNSNDIKRREKVFECFKELFKLHRGASVHIFVEASGKTRLHVARSFRSILRVFMPFLGRLKQAGYNVCIAMNPYYAQSAVKNNAASRFSIVPGKAFPYSFTLKDGELSTTGIERDLGRVRSYSYSYSNYRHS